VGERQSALDALAAEDLHVLPAAVQLARTAELVRARNRIDAELARTVRIADLTQAPEHDGLTTMRSWLRGHARLPAATGPRPDFVRVVQRYLARLDDDGPEPAEIIIGPLF